MALPGEWQGRDRVETGERRLVLPAIGRVHENRLAQRQGEMVFPETVGRNGHGMAAGQRRVVLSGKRSAAGGTTLNLDNERPPEASATLQGRITISLRNPVEISRSARCC